MTVAVIGHGRSPVGKGWGPLIDACDEVIRMWDCHWQDAPDWGTKYDYGYFELSAKQMSRFKFYNQRQPSKYWIGGLLKRTDPALYPKNTQVVQFGNWVQLAKDLGGIGTTGRLKFTRGCTAACWSIKELRADPVILVGFDNSYTGTALDPFVGFPDAYRKLESTVWKGYVGGGTKYHNHDYAIEDVIFKHLAKGAGCKVYYAQDIWK